MTDQQVLRKFDAAVETLPRKSSELRRLWIAAAEAGEAFSRVCSEPGVFVTDAAFHRLEAVSDDARNDLLDHLLTEFGLTSADLKRSVL